MTEVKCFSCGTINEENEDVPSQYWQCFNCDSFIGPDSPERWYHEKLQEARRVAEELDKFINDNIGPHQKTYGHRPILPWKVTPPATEGK